MPSFEHSEESEQHYRAAFNQATVGMAISSLGAVLEEVNERFAETLGYRKDELIGKAVIKLTHADDIPKTRAHLDELIAGKRDKYVMEKRFICKNGQTVWCLTSVSMMKDACGRGQKLIGVVEDITERVEAEATRQRLAAVVESSDDAIISMGLDTIIATWNAGAQRMFGYKAEEVIGKSIVLLIPKDRENEEPGIIRRILTGERVNHYETIRQHKDGEPLHVSLTVSPIRDADGKIVGLSKILRDITEKKRAEEALRRAQDELKQHADRLEEQVAERTKRLRETIHEMESFSYSVSHDMRSPLRAMQGYADALLEDYQGKLDKTGEDYLSRIRRAASRMDLLIQDVLAYSRVAQGDIPLREVNVDTVLSDVVQNYATLHEGHAAVMVDGSIPLVVGHEAYLTQIISNFLGNAVKFVEPGIAPKVKIHATMEGDLVRINFTDNGIGIAPEHQKQIFQIFGRVYSEKKFEGTGVGLAIAKKAAERMGGSVGLDSQLGRGSTFYVRLKRAV